MPVAVSDLQIEPDKQMSRPAAAHPLYERDRVGKL
jgi:hypothetical protein